MKPLEHYFTNNENLDSKLRILSYNYKGINIDFYSDLGVFSKNKIDFGSRLLVETFLSFNHNNISKVLDVGSGYGFVGITLSKVLNVKVDMIDINKRAIHLTDMNIKKNNIDGKAFISNIYDDVSDKYDLIVTNPPIRAGKEVVLKILLGAREHLNINGELWFVIRKDQGAKSIIKCIENVYFEEIIAKSKGFYIISAKIR